MKNPPPPLAQKSKIELLQPPNTQTTLLLTQTNNIPFNPSYFPNILTSPQKNALKIDPRIEIIPEGALKKERK